MRWYPSSMASPTHIDTTLSGATTRTSRPEFFSQGGPLSPDGAGYVERQADETVWNALQGLQYVNLTGAPKSGKTSLLLRLAKRLRNSDEPPVLAMIEIRQLIEREGREDVARCFYAIAFRLARQLRVGFDLQDWWADNAMLPHHLRFLELFREFTLANPGKRLVLLFDDTGDLIRREEGEPLLTAIRLAFDARTTDPEMARLSILFGSTGDAQFGVAASEKLPHEVSVRIQLESFTLGQTLRLAPALGFSREIAEFAMQRIYDWVAGQPSMTQALAARLATRETDAESVAAVVDALAERLLARSFSSSSDDYINAASRRILDTPRTERDQMLVALGRVSKVGRLLFDAKSAAHDRLLAVGLTQLSPDGFLVPGSRLLRRRFGAAWANGHLAVKYAGVVGSVIVALAAVVLPVWYFSVLPQGWVRTLTDVDSSPAAIEQAHRRLARLPGHTASADRLLAFALDTRFDTANSPEIVDALDALASGGGIDESRRRRWRRSVWLRERDKALSEGDRLGAIRALSSALNTDDGTLRLERELSSLLGTDLAQLRSILDTGSPVDAVRYQARSGVLVSRHGALLQFWTRDARTGWSAAAESLSPTALRAPPANLRFELPAINRPERLEAELQITHPRPQDLLLTVTAPNGNSASVSVDALPSNQWRLADVPEFNVLAASMPAGIWSMTVVDVMPDMTGEIVLASLGGIGADALTGLDIQDPASAEALEVSLAGDARFAIAMPDASGNLAAAWDLTSRKLVAAIPVDPETRVLGFGNRGTEVFLGSASRLSRWRLSDGMRLPIPDDLNAVGGVWVSPNGAYLAGNTADDEALVILDVRNTGVVARLASGRRPSHVAITDDGAFVAVADPDQVVRIWSSASGAFIAQLPVDSTLIGLEFVGDQLLIYRDFGGLLSWSPDRSRSLTRWTGEPGWSAAHDVQTTLTMLGSGKNGFRIHDLAGRRDRTLPILGLSRSSLRAELLRVRDAMAVFSEPSAGRISVWEPSLPALPVGGFRIQQAWLSDNGKAIAFSDYRDAFTALRLDEDIPGLSVVDDAVAPVTHVGTPSIVRFSPDGVTALSIERQGLFRLHDLERVRARREIGRISGEVSGAAFNLSGDYFAVVAGNQVLGFDAGSGELYARQSAGERLNAITWNAPTQRWLMGDARGNVLEWDGDQQSPLQPVAITAGGPVDHIAGNLVGNHIVIASGRIMQLIDAGTGGLVGAPLELPASVESMRTTPDGRYVVVRAGRWLMRIRDARVGLSISDQRLLPAGALNHSGFAIMDAEGSAVMLLDGLDEPMPRVLHFDFSDVTPVSSLVRKRLNRVLGIVSQ
ncbi:MAG: AAA-like domain-containing protein [Pseudomonadota bacterium]